MTLAALTLSLERHLYTRLRARADARSPLPPHLLTGQRGEDAAFFHLRSQGYTIVARRWRAQRVRGDLDLVAWDGDTLVIVEVKTRSARDFAPAAAEVDRFKQEQLRRMAGAYLAQLPEAHRAAVPLRFDVLSVYLLTDAVEFEHIPNAFPRTSQFPRFGV
jgi:putative endonuclease